MTFIDNFELEGPHGRHICLVQSAMGRLPLLKNERFPVSVVKSIAAKQLLSALRFLHSDKLDNILVELRYEDLIRGQQVNPAV